MFLQPLPSDSWDGGTRKHDGCCTVLSKLDDLPALIETITEAMAEYEYPEKAVFGMRLSLEEAVVNSIKHGHGHDPSKQVRVHYCVDEDQATVEIEDEGPGFDPCSLPDPLAPENLERPCGRGVFLMRHYMTSVRFSKEGRSVTLCKRRAP